MQEYTSPSERLKALTDQLEQGVSDIFQSGQYAAYLTAMSKFHHYSFGNTDAIEEVGFFQSVPLWMVTFLGSLFITVLSFILIMTVYGRFFRLYMFTALAPLPLASFAGEDTSFMGKAFLRSYLGVCMEGAIVVLACLIFSAFAASGAPIADTSLPVVTMSWQYVAQTIFNMLILVALIKGAERIAKEMFGL